MVLMVCAADRGRVGVCGLFSFLSISLTLTKEKEKMEDLEDILANLGY